MLFEDVAAHLFARDTEAFYNPTITKIEVTTEGVPNKLFSQGILAYQMWDEAKFFAAGSKRQPEVAEVAKDLALADVSLGEFLTSKYSLWFVLRTTDHGWLHAAIVAQTVCGKTVFILDLLEGPYREVFRQIVVLCPTVRHNKTYHQRPWIWADAAVYVLDPGERLHDYLPAFYLVFQGEPTLYVIDDCSATKALTKKDMFSELAFSGRHAKTPVWVLT